MLISPRETYRKLTNDNTFSLLLTSIFTVTSLLAVKFHEMWRDETQAWLFARDSSSPLDLMRNLRYEGHPPVWHFLLFIATRITANPVAMQLIHVSIAALTIYLIARFSPFRKIQKLLISFGYFMLYEFGIVARNYNVTVLFIITFCVLMTRKRKNYVLIGLNLFLLSQTNVMGALVVPALTLYTFWDFWQDWNKRKKVWSDWRRPLLSGAAALVGLVLLYWQTQTPADANFKLLTFHDFRNVISTIWQSYVPMPARIVSFWGTNYISIVDQVSALSVLLLIGATVFFSRNAKVLVTFLFSTTTLISFFYFKNQGSVRHHGFLFIILLACAWLMYSETSFSLKQKAFLWYQTIFITAILLAQFAAGSYAVYKDYKYTFSRSRSAAQYLKANQLDRLPIVGAVDYQTSALLGYLNKQAYYAQSARWGSFVVWDNRRLEPINQEELLAAAKRVATEKNSEVLFVSNVPVSETHKEFKFQASFTEPAVVVDEIYFFYTVSPGS